MLGKTQATRLKPDLGGSAYTFVPNSWTKPCVITSSESPRATDWSSSFSIAVEVVHPMWLHCVNTWLHSHMHMNLPPICLVRSTWAATGKPNAEAATPAMQNRNAVN